MNKTTAHLLTAAAEVACVCEDSLLQAVYNPQWDSAGHGPNNWRNHVPQFVMDCWEELPLEARAIAYAMAEEAAGCDADHYGP